MKGGPKSSLRPFLHRALQMHFVLYFIPCLEKYSQLEARIILAYLAVCNR